MDSDSMYYDKASLFQRLLAHAIDFGLILIVSLFFMIKAFIIIAQAEESYQRAMDGMSPKERKEFKAETSLEGLAYLYILGICIRDSIIVVIGIQLLILIFRHQTLGKCFMHIKIYHPKIFGIKMSFYVLVRQVLPFSFLFIPKIKGIPIGNFIFVANYIYLLGKEHRCFHDHLLGTDVESVVY